MRFSFMCFHVCVSSESEHVHLFLSDTLRFSVTGTPSAPQARMEEVCVTASQCPWLNKPLISYMFLCPPRNDIPRGREHISVPAKHLPLLCCPSSSLCHPAHCLMDGADGRGCLPDSNPTQPTHQRERARARDKETEGKAGTLFNPPSQANSEHLKDRHMEGAQYQTKCSFPPLVWRKL